jgi:serine/threonine-protein kinase RsbT
VGERQRAAESAGGFAVCRTSGRLSPDLTREESISVRSDVDIVVARRRGRQLAASLGFGPTDQTLIATAISELTRNIVLYAERGQVVLKPLVGQGGKRGIMVVARDHGPGISNVEQALQSGFSTSGGLGLGLPGVRRLTDEFDIASEVGRGTTVTVKKWNR